MVNEGKFREDLYYRLNVIPIFLPSLRERREDVPELVRHFIEKANEENGKHVEHVSEEAWEHLMNYSWPGNVRELENAIQRAVIMCKGIVLERQHFPVDLQANIRLMTEQAQAGASGDQSLETAVEKLERAMMADALQRTNGNKRKASQLLGVTERIFGYKAKQYGLASAKE